MGVLDGVTEAHDTFLEYMQCSFQNLYLIILSGFHVLLIFRGIGWNTIMSLQMTSLEASFGVVFAIYTLMAMVLVSGKLPQLYSTLFSIAFGWAWLAMALIILAFARTPYMCKSTLQMRFRTNAGMAL